MFTAQQKTIRDNFVREMNEKGTFSGWDMEMIVGYYQQRFSEVPSESDVEEAIKAGLKLLK